MSHGLELDDLMVAAGGRSRAPWHYSMTSDRTTLVDADSISSEDIMAMSGLDWQTDKHPMYVKVGSGWSEKDFIEATDHYATVRADTRKFLGVVSPDYHIIQNHKLKQLLETVVGEAGADFITAGSLNGNRRIWFLIRMPQTIEIAGMPSEKSELYMLATTSHGGQFGRGFESTRFLPTYVRVVCQNTLAWAVQGTHAAYSIPHIGDVDFKLDQAREAIGLTLKYSESVQEMAEILVQQRYTRPQLASFLDSLFPVVVKPSKELMERQERARIAKKRDVLVTLTTREDLVPIRETNWGLLQAVSAYEAHDKRFASPERRFETVMGMSGTDSLTTRAASILTSRSFLSPKATQDILDALDTAESD